MPPGRGRPILGNCEPPRGRRTALDAGAARNNTGTRVRAVRHLRRPQAARRRDRALGIPRPPQAPASRRATRLDVVGAARSRLVDRGALRRRLDPVRTGHGARVRGRRGRAARRADVLHRLAVLHLGRLPAVPRGGRRRAAATGHRPPQGLRVPARPDRLAGDRRAARGDPRVQRQHVRCHLRRRGHGAGAAPRLAPRRLRFGLLPGRQPPGLVRGVPRLDGLAAEIAGLVDHGGEPARFGRVRVLRRSQLRHPGDDRAAQRPGDQPRHLHRRAVLPGRRGAPAVRADRGATRRHGGSAAAVRPGRARPAVTGRATSSGWSGPSRSCGAGSRRPG